MAGLFLSVVSVLPQLWQINQTGGVIEACTGRAVECEKRGRRSLHRDAREQSSTAAGAYLSEAI